jgi:hypothetical protein
MMKSFGLAAACMLIASAASAQVQNYAPGSGASNNAVVGHTQTVNPPASGNSAPAGPTTGVQTSAPGSGAANNATAGLSQTQAPPATGHGKPAPAPVQNFPPGSGASNNAVVGHSQTQPTK